MAEPTTATVVVHAKAHPVMGAVVALCAYEVVADVVNDMLDADLLPSFRHVIERFSWGRVSRALVPRWGPSATVVAGGILAGAAVRARSRARGAQPSKR